MTDFMQGDKDNAVAVPFSDDETPERDDSLDDDAPGASPEERITRQKKRTERIKRILDEGNKNAKEVESLRAELSALKGETERLKGFVAAQPTQRQDTGKDPYEAELDAVYERQQSAYTAAQAEIKAGTWNEERQRYYERVARDIETDKSRIHTRREIAAREPAQRAEQGRQAWVQKYPDVYGSPNAYEYAEGRFKQRKALGEVVTNELIDEVMTETRRAFKMGPKPAPSATDRQRMSGIAASGGGGGGSSRSDGITMTPEFRRMAEAAYSDLPAPEAHKKWVNTTGKKLREKKII